MKFKNRFTDVRTWIVFFFLIRLIGITNPPLEVGHNWRQSTVAMVSRNFLEIDNNIFYPRLDIAGEKTGITGMEFPLLNYFIYLMAELFGYQHWYGRLINLVISSLGLCFFYKLLRKYFSEKTSFYSTIILTVSIWFQFSRKIMPDIFSMSMIIACIYYGTGYLEKMRQQKHHMYLLSYFLLLMCGVLSKLPSAYLFVIFGIYFLNKHIPIERKLIFSLVSFLGLLPAVLWYFYWVPHLVKTYEFWHFFMGKNFIQGFHEIIQNAIPTLRRFYDTALKFIGFGIFVYGLIVAVIKKDRKIYLVFFSSLLSFSIIICKAGYTFTHHNYYIIPYVPVMALIAGYGLTKIKYPNIALILLVAISVEGMANQYHDFRIKENDKHIVNLEKDLDKISQRSDLILINSGSYPTPMYFSHRKGWITSNENVTDKEYIEDLKNKGLKFIVILKKGFGSKIKITQYKKVLDNEDYSIYDVNVSEFVEMPTYIEDKNIKE